VQRVCSWEDDTLVCTALDASLPRGSCGCEGRGGGNIISAAGVTVGLDAALVLVSLLRGDAAAKEIQFAIEYSPAPVFHSGTPDTAPAKVLESVQREYKPMGAARETEALRHAANGTASRSGI
jgi:cyclohexyl-isocyanide hydratase